ncbi:PREDICTED: MAGUK p55 subfamily member 6-like isoform X2 [Priapulus caudatus]|uniref:MAGUK p55 subfamily member 6-like isoform X2 n=1 Tax=Priapulus caudatus TaxID=37621 RepID=A0ABM1EC38_PRICU|nr:PREDICTED: MAGUK p55 subfamily member 6-like isoform X2 [Priapulus caudatus]
MRDAEQARLMESTDKLNKNNERGFVSDQFIKSPNTDINHVTAQHKDLVFLQSLLDSPAMKNLIKAHDKLDAEEPLKPVLGGENSTELIQQIFTDLAPHKYSNTKASELSTILRKPHVKAIIEAHDTIAQKKFDKLPSPKIASRMAPPVYTAPPPDAIRMVGIRKVEGEPLGITIATEDGDLSIARILQGGMIDRQGLLHVGDIIKEVNGIEVRTPEELQLHMKKAVGSITLKIIPSYTDSLPTAQVFMKVHFSYDPSKDTLIPCKEAGLFFHKGDILEIVNQEDPNWWQARKVGEDKAAGLIPSLNLEESRKAFCKPELDFTKTVVCGSIKAKRKKKVLYSHSRTMDMDRHELLLYEEVARMPPFQRKTLVLIGAQGVGRRTIKSRLINSDPTRYGTTIPHTSRAMRPGEEDGRKYFFTDRAIMERDMAADEYLESGELDGNIYGTKLDTMRQVVRAGKMCVIDCNSVALKKLSTPEFMPFVVFLQAPDINRLRNMHEQAVREGHIQKNLAYERELQNRSVTMSTLDTEFMDMTEEDFDRTVNESYRLQKNYDCFFDLTIVNDDFEKTFVVLHDAIQRLATEPQWVPVNWVY